VQAVAVPPLIEAKTSLGGMAEGPLRAEPPVANHATVLIEVLDVPFQLVVTEIGPDAVAAPALYVNVMFAGVADTDSDSDTVSDNVTVAGALFIATACASARPGPNNIMSVIPTTASCLMKGFILFSYCSRCQSCRQSRYLGDRGNFFFGAACKTFKMVARWPSLRLGKSGRTH